MAHVVIIHATFANKADADHIYDQAISVATNASVAHLGQPQERTSHGFVAEEVDGELVVDRSWHIDLFGIVRSGEPFVGDVPPWIQPTGAQDAYPLLNVRGGETLVTHDGKTWRNLTAANTSAPGVADWEDVDAEIPDPDPDPILPWVQPTGGHDAYQIGDRVTHNGKTWESTHANNVWDPSIFGWVVV